MSYVTHLECAGSGTRFDADDPAARAPGTGDFPLVRYDLDRLRHEVTRETIRDGPGSLWRYSPLLPLRNAGREVTLGEGWTPLVPLPTLGRHLGCRHVYAKDEGRNPSGTFKDRGASVAVSRLRELGIESVVHASSGNAAAAWALYGARGGLKVVNVVPEDVLPASLAQSILAGADTRILRAAWSAAGPIVRKLADDNGWYACGTLMEPWRVEGKKTMALEICEQLAWQLPDTIIYPVGGGLGPIAMYKGFSELAALGWIPAGPLPRLVVTQYAGCAPIVEAFRAGSDSARTWERPDVLPGGLKSVRPPGDRAVLRLLNETGGTAIAIETEAALDAAARLTRHEGMFPCPESATVVAGLEQALARGEVDRGERIVLMITGSGLKSVPVFPVPGPGTIETTFDC